MAEYVATATTSAPPSEAYSYLADFRTIIDWDPSVTDARLLSGEPATEGAQYRVTLGAGPLGYPMTYRTVVAQPPSSDRVGRVELRAENAHVVSHDTITFAPDGDGGTVVVYRAELLPKGIRKLGDPMFALMINFFGARARNGLQQAVAALGTAGVAE